LARTQIYVMEVESVNVASWTPGPEGTSIPPTQVHLIVTIRGARNPLLMRYKSRRALQDLIDALIEHRNYTWPDGARQG
jgi:hypothetical protein